MVVVGAAAGISLLAAGLGFSTEGNPGGALPGLTEDQVRLFVAGREDFSSLEEPNEGLGPLFNGRGCVECHAVPTVGGVTDSPTLRERRIGRMVNGRFDPMLEFGGPVLHLFSITGLRGQFPDQVPADCHLPEVIPVPEEAQFLSLRQPQPLFGMGLVEAIPAETILDNVGRFRRLGIRGKANFNGPRLGRFGWKAGVPSLLEFSGEAYLVEMGITNAIAPQEAHELRSDRAFRQAGRCDTGPELEAATNEGNSTGVGAILNFTNFMRFLAPLPRGPITPAVQRGERIFARVGCGACHVPEMRTGKNPIAALSQKPVRAFSDFLLHDMGDGLADGIEQGLATGREFRTAPLWGLRFRPFFLHDGRTTDLQEAILLHGGEAEKVIEAFRDLPDRARQDLLDFLRSL
jgi:CxxC motif-containing protein (DUF1111 family)